MGAAVSANRNVRIFVSSTFRDMIEDRDALMAHAWPELKRICREAQIELIEVDLRWGITEEQSTRRQTIEVCLREIRECRPYFVCLLGERYGWVPCREDFTEDLTEELPWLATAQDRSVTELEILHGVLNEPAMSTRSFFYFRDPAYARRRGGDFMPASSVEGSRQSALKQMVRDNCESRGIALHEPYDDPEMLVKLVVADLSKVLLAQFPAVPASDWNERAARAHTAFGDRHRHAFVARTGCFADLDRHREHGGSPLLVVGEPGSGKSALLANWAARVRAEEPEQCVIEHYVGGAADDATHWSVMKHLMYEIGRWTGADDSIPSDRNEVVRQFPRWLARARSHAEETRSRVVVIVDGVDHLDNVVAAGSLHWLQPRVFTGPLELFLSSGSVEHHEALGEVGVATVSVAPLRPDERRTFVVDYLRHFGKGLEERQIERLAGAPQTASPLYLRTLLNELRVTGTYGQLDERVRDYLAARNTSELLSIVVRRYQRDYEADRPGLVRDALALIMYARRGLTESELLEILRPADLPHLPMAVWAPLRAALDDQLVAYNGIMRLADSHQATAVEAAFALDATLITTYRRMIAEYFSTKPRSYARYREMADRVGQITVLTNYARSIDEAPWQLAKLESWAELADLLARPDLYEILRAADETEARGYWIALEAEAGISTTAIYGDMITDPRRLTPNYATSFATLLRDLGHVAEASQLISGWLNVSREVWNAAAVVAPAICWASILHVQGRYEEAGTTLLGIANEARERQDEGTLATALLNLAGLRIAQGRLDVALVTLDEVESLSAGHADTARMASIQASVAAALSGRGEYDRALTMHENAEATFLHLGDLENAALTMVNRAGLLAKVGSPDAALSLFSAAEELCRRIHSQRQLARCLCAKGRLLISLGLMEDGLALELEVAASAEALEDKVLLADALGQQAGALIHLGRFDEALEALTVQERICRDAGDIDGLQATFGNLAMALMTGDRHEEAIAAAVRCRDLCAEMGNRPGMQHAVALIANIKYLSGDVEAARQLLDEGEGMCDAQASGGVSIDIGMLRALILLDGGALLGALAKLDDCIRACGSRGDSLRLVRITKMLTEDCAGHEVAETECAAQLARMLYGLVKVYVHMGAMDLVEECHEGVIRVYSNVLGRSSISHMLDLKNELAAANARLANHYQMNGETAKAIEHFERRRALREEICAGDPSNVRHRYQFGVAHEVLGDLLDVSGELDRAREVYERGCNVLEEMEASGPQDDHVSTALANVCQKLTDLCTRMHLDGEASHYAALWARHSLGKFFGS